MIGIYKIENLITHKVYIGQSVDVKKRWTEHKHLLKNNKHDNQFLQNAWNKYGEENFKFCIVEKCATRKQLNDRETYWKEYFDKQHGTYNLGRTGNAHNTSQETREKISLIQKGKKMSNESKSLISKNNARGFLGKKHSKKTKKIISLNSKKMWQNENTRNKLVVNLKKYAIGRKLTESQKQYLSDIKSKSVVQCDLQGNEIKIWKSITIAEQETKITHISCVCTGKRKTAGGYIWKFKKEN